jgi:hypothetical protein
VTVAAGIIALENSYVDPKVAVPAVSSSDGGAMIYAANKSKIQCYFKESESVVIDSNKSPLQFGTLSNFVNDVAAIPHIASCGNSGNDPKAGNTSQDGSMNAISSIIITPENSGCSHANQFGNLVVDKKKDEQVMVAPVQGKTIINGADHLKEVTLKFISKPRTALF